MLKEIICGLHASGIAASPNGKFVAIANAASDSISIIETTGDKLAETISMRWAVNDPFGASPNALAFSADGRQLYVCNGTQNAVAVVDFRPGRSKLKGLVGTGWFPGAIVLAQDGINGYIANIKGLGSSKRIPPNEKTKFNSHQYFGSVSLMWFGTSIQQYLQLHGTCRRIRSRGVTWPNRFRMRARRNIFVSASATEGARQRAVGEAPRASIDSVTGAASGSDDAASPLSGGPMHR